MLLQYHSLSRRDEAVAANSAQQNPHFSKPMGESERRNLERAETCLDMANPYFSNGTQNLGAMTSHSPGNGCKFLSIDGMSLCLGNSYDVCDYSGHDKHPHDDSGVAAFSMISVQF